MASSIEISLFFTQASSPFLPCASMNHFLPLTMLAFNGSSSLQNILPLDLQNGSTSLYSLIFDSIDTFLRLLMAFGSLYLALRFLCFCFCLS